MLMQTIREQIAEYGRKMLEDGLTRNTGGYLASFDRKLGLAAVTPSGMAYEKIRPEDVVIVDLDGNKIEGTGKPSTEWPVVQKVFSCRTDIDALVHTHSTYATTISALRWELPAACFTTSRAGGVVRCCDFYNYTSQELADAIVEKMQDRYAVLMGNHGLVAAGKDIPQAYITAEEVEFGCEVYWRARSVGQPVCLTDAQLDDLVKEIARYAKEQEARR